MTRFSILNPGRASDLCCSSDCFEPCDNPHFDLPIDDDLTSGYDHDIDPQLGVYTASGPGYFPQPDGRIVQFGPHDELITEPGVYQGLYESWIGNTRSASA